MQKYVKLIFLKKRIYLNKVKSKNKILFKIIIILILLIIFYLQMNKVNHFEIFNINQFFNIRIRKNSILIFENNDFHYECTPGFTKYFIDLGFNVDIIMTKIGQGIFTFFEQASKLRFFILDDSIYSTLSFCPFLIMPN